MALTTCKECGKAQSASADRCPHCGHQVRKTSLVTWIVTALIGIPLIVGILVGAVRQAETPPAAKSIQGDLQRKSDAAVQRAAAGAVMLKKTMRDPASFELDSALVIEGGGAVCYSYRAKNGFGGFNAGQAVLSSNGKILKTNEMDGFAALWNEECAKKRGTEVATSINWFAL